MLGKGEKKEKVKFVVRPRRPFWGPLVAILDFADVASGERLPPALLGWYFVHILSDFNALKKESI